MYLDPVIRQDRRSEGGYVRGDYLSLEDSWRGQFWLPGQMGQNDQQGILMYRPGHGVTLSLIGGFDDRRLTQLSSGTHARSEGSGRFPVIQGVAGDKPITLIDCLATQSTSRGMLRSQVEEQEILADRALMGVLLDDPDAAAFSELTIELENLAEWDHRNDVVIQFSPDGTRWHVAVDPVDPLRVTVDDLTIELVRWHPKPSHQSRRDRIEVPTLAFSYLTIRSSQPRSVAQWGETSKAFQDLLTLAMDAPCAVLSESLTPSNALLVAEAARSRSEIQVYAQHIAVGDPDMPSVLNRDALFTLSTEGLDFETLVPAWLEVNSRFRVVCDMILGLKYAEGGYIQTQLITAVAAAEALHEALELGPPMPNSEFKALKKLLVERVPENRKQWLREKLGRNKRTLRTQLLDLAAIPDPEVMRALVPNPDAWAEATKNERDPVAHGGKTMSRDGPLLNAITKVTTAVVLVNLLHRLGIPKGRLMMGLDYNRTLKVAKRLAREHWPAVSAEDANGEEGTGR